jgi:PKD repeat protein
MMVPIAAQALVAESPTPTDSPDHGLGEFGRVNDVAVVGNVAYLAGNFSSVGGASRDNLAAISITTGQATSWNPGTNGPVLEIEPSPDGATLYIGGSFTRVDGQTRNRVAAVTTAGGDATGWNPGASGEVRDLEVSGNTVYVAGAFSDIGGSGISFLAAVDRSSGNVNAGWDPSPASSVTATDLSSNGATLYIGGGFGFVGGQNRPHLAAVSTASGSVTGWSTTTPHRVIDIDTAASGSLVYAAVGGPQAEGGNLATAYSATSGGAPVWSRSSDGDFQAVAVAPDAVYWGGHFVWSQGITRERLMAMDPLTGAVLDWDPGANSGWGIFSLTYQANRLFAGGDFTIAGGITQPHFAMFEETGPIGPIDPTAAFTWSCSLLSCDFDGSTSSDPDGFITNWGWTFEGGGSGSGVTPSHTFPGSGSYDVDLTVTDNDGRTNTVAHLVTVNDQPGSGIEFVGVESAAGNATAIDVAVPNGASIGDTLLLFASANGNDMTISAPVGWTPLDGVVSSSMTTNAWYRATQPTDAGSLVTVSMTDRQKVDAVIVAYTGTNASDPVAAFAADAETIVRFGHTTPTVAVGVDGTRIVSYWANKTSGATSWTAPGGEVVRHAGYGTGGGRITALLTDGGFEVSSGTHGGLTATSDDDGGKATMWTVALAPSGPPPANQPPTAVFTSSCTSLSCAFDGTASNDPDGTVVDWDWDFGDGSTSTGATTNHTYATADTFTIELTVTDNDGDTHTTTNTITTTNPPLGSAIEFRGVTEFSGNVSVVDTTIPAATQTGDALLMFVTMNGSNQTLTPPAGWTELATQADQSMETRVYLRVASAGDAGSDVTLTLSAWRKTVVAIAAYGGVDSADPVSGVAAAPETSNTAVHVTPSATATHDGSFVLSYWADKTSSTTSWTAPGSITERVMVTTSGGGRVTALFGDLGPVSPGTHGGLAATANSNGGKATMFTIVLTPGP